MTTVDISGTKFRVRAEIAELIYLLVAETKRRGYVFGKAGDPSYGCWGYSCRAIGGTTTPSNHSWGLAVDINAPKNPYSKRGLITDMPAWMPTLWKQYGFRWGGDYTRVKDAMHYEFMGSLDDARIQTERARQALGDGDVAPVPPPPPKPKPEPIPQYGDNLPLRVGSRGANVVKVQVTLRIKADGIYGPITRDRVKLFQAARKISVDGVVGATTWGKMFNSRSQYGYGKIYRHTLWYGKKNSDSVRNLQQRLNDLGFKAGAVDGSYGPKTKAAVARFQVSQGWSGSGADGKIVASRYRPVGGTLTLKRLFQYPGSPYRLYQL